MNRFEQSEYIWRKETSCANYKRKAELGQFMTPSKIAIFMASLFRSTNIETCRLLDPGAGLGALTCAFLDRWVEGGFGFQSVEVTAYEIDGTLRACLVDHLKDYKGLHSDVIEGDYIEMSTCEMMQGQKYTHAILNPPYKKIRSNSSYRLCLRRLGIETVNLYSAFVALAVMQSDINGQIVAIIPRSFCNGPYYRSFREYILKRVAFRRIHLFHSRDKAFKDDNVLQENVIICLERGAQQGPVTISTSTDDTFDDLDIFEIPFEQIVRPDDPEHFIHVPTSTAENILEKLPAICHSLDDIGIKVSTGPVVDFRMKEHLRDMPESGTVPLLYPGHFSSKELTWPLLGFRKPNAICRNEATEKWLFPNGFYCAVRRFSSKEEKRRVVASLVDPQVFGEAEVLGFENHLNLFHEKKHGLPKALAVGLSLFLNTAAVDEYFRRFNGHTQVNATDLRLMKYPSREALMRLGDWAQNQPELSQKTVDERIGELIA